MEQIKDKDYRELSPPASFPTDSHWYLRVSCCAGESPCSPAWLSAQPQLCFGPRASDMEVADRWSPMGWRGATIPGKCSCHPSLLSWISFPGAQTHSRESTGHSSAEAVCSPGPEAANTDSPVWPWSHRSASLDLDGKSWSTVFMGALILQAWW